MFLDIRDTEDMTDLTHMILTLDEGIILIQDWVIEVFPLKMFILGHVLIYLFILEEKKLHNE